MRCRPDMGHGARHDTTVRNGTGDEQAWCRANLSGGFLWVGFGVGDDSGQCLCASYANGNTHADIHTCAHSNCSANTHSHTNAYADTRTHDPL